MSGRVFLWRCLYCQSNENSFQKGKRVQDNKRHGLSQDEAMRIAIEALGFVASDMDLLGRFLAVSGLGPETLRAAASDPNFLLGVLEFLMSDESALLVFCENSRIRPTMIAAAHLALTQLNPDDSN